MEPYRTTLALAQKLVSLPSYVGDNQDETPVTDFLFGFLQDAFPTMIVERQYLENSKRCNLILRSKGSLELFVLGHIDTVQPKDGWQTDPLNPVVKDGKLYGLGASDMKGSLTAFLCALMQAQQSIKTENLMLLMYIDEEYDFKGIKRFLTDKQTKSLKPKLTLSLDGELAVATGCRGLIEISFTVKGKSGHSSNPKNGIDAITETIAVLQEVSKDLASFNDKSLGETTTNVAYIQGGVRGNKNTWLLEGNIISDTVEAIFEVRPATHEVTADFVLQRIEAAMKKRGLSLAESSIRHDITPWPVIYNKASLALLKQTYAKADVPFAVSDRKLQGYIDAQMVTEKIDAPTYIIGTGGENKHGANENVLLENIKQAGQLYQSLLRTYIPILEEKL